MATIDPPAVDGDKLMQFVFRAVDEVGATLNAALVVMGDTHLPEKHAASDSTTYVNLGAWAEDDVDEGHRPNLPATRTHLVVADAGDEPVTELFTWRDEGPTVFRPET